MKITLLCSDERHPVNEHLYKWIDAQQGVHQVDLVRKKKELPGGDILFLVSCAEIIRIADRSLYRATLVLHASDLPHGRGWSPHIWQLTEGADEITLSLVEAEDKVDSGRIWNKIKMPIPKHALWNEINWILFAAEIELIDFAVRNFETISPVPQDPSVEPSYYPRRSPEDSLIDPSKTIASQFDKIRVCDPHRFPAFFEMHGRRYRLILEGIDD